MVTGGSRGIGLQVGRSFNRLGARVGLIARDAAALAAACQQLGRGACWAVADVSAPDQLASAMAELESQLGSPTVLVNNAGHGQWGAVVDTELVEFRRAIEVNYLGAVHATALVLPGMLQRGRGCIVNVASIAGRIGAPFEAAYSASKFALVGYSEALAAEVAGSGVAVSLIEAGPVDTDFAAERVAPRRRGAPRPIAAERVADTIVAAVLGRQGERYLPRWLRLAHVAKTTAPVLHRTGVGWMFATDRRALRQRYERSISTPPPK